MALGDHHLDIAGQIADVQENQLAGRPHQENSARNTHLGAYFLAFPLLGLPSSVIDRDRGLKVGQLNDRAVLFLKVDFRGFGTDCIDKESLIKTMAPRVDSHGLDLLELFEPRSLMHPKFMRILRARIGLRVRHCLKSVGV